MAWTSPSSRLRPFSPDHAPMPYARPQHVRSPRSLASVRRAFTALLVALVMLACVEGQAAASGCKVEHCTRQFQQAAMASGVRRGPSPAFCVILRQYSDCLRSTARSCRGHLAYHSTITLVQNWNGDFNCSYVGAGGGATAAAKEPPIHRPSGGRNGHGDHRDSGGHGRDEGAGEKAQQSVSLEPTARVYRPEKPSIQAAVPPPPPPPQAPSIVGTSSGTSIQACNYQGRMDVTHCSFYGDPHLVTFNGDFQTCKVAGAWPLIDNAYLAVSVTNEAVVPGSAATATTKITIIIKGDSKCAPERTYEAAVDAVPASFVDGSQWGGPVPANAVHNLSPSALEHLVPVRIVEKEAGRHVEIQARHLGATLVVRQVGRYLTFAARLPRDIAEQSAAREGLQLCVKGCPASERIDLAAVLTGSKRVPPPPPHSSAVSGRFNRQSEASAAVNGMNREAALALCREYKLTDYYLDSCMFDLMTTGDPSFSLAASKAQADYVSLVPDAVQRLQNRTWPLSSAASQGSLSSSSAAASPIREAHGPGRPPLCVQLLLAWVLMSLFNLLR